MECKICGKATKHIFSAKVLSKYDAKYFECINCGFIQTETPHWLAESYNSAITHLDIGLIQRNIKYASIVELLIHLSFNKKGTFIDYGAGYGMFVRMMRDKGFNFQWQDDYCSNLFAAKFEAPLYPDANDAEMVTAFEVFEHLLDPRKEITRMLKYSKTILFSTELRPSKDLNAAEDWWYFSPVIGQHIAFYSRKSLSILAKEFNLEYTYLGNSLHLFAPKGKAVTNFLRLQHRPKLKWLYETFMLKKMPSLLQADYTFLVNN